MDSNYQVEVLDLHDISLLLNYERATTEPRFRHSKLREVAKGGSDFKTVRLNTPDWTKASIPKIGYIFEKPENLLSEEEENELDLPSNMLPTPIPATLRNLTPQTLELYYWQPRNHDGCFRTVVLFQHFIGLFPELTRIRVRVVENKKPRTYSTLAVDRRIVEMKLTDPVAMNASLVLPINQSYITGSITVSLHAVLGFSPPGGNIDTILDLASLQFGDAGRGFNGKGLFVLEPALQYLSRLDRYAKKNNANDAKITRRINGNPDNAFVQDDNFLKQVAQRTKARWEKRASEHWCGHCGAPSRAQPLKRCALCQKAHYCDKVHQVAAWPFHKHFCAQKRQ